LVLIFFSETLTLFIGWQEGNLACEKCVPFIPRVSLPEQVEEEEQDGNG